MKKSWNPNKYDKHARFVSNLALDLVDLLELMGDERVLDIGCGDGVLSKEIQKKAKELIGIDSNLQMVQKARQNGIDAKVMDICEIDFKDKFDRVFSNAVLHWVKEQKTALQNINNSIKKREVFAKRDYKGFENPWYFPNKDEYAKLLRDSGFEILYIELIPRFTEIDDMANWIDLFADGIIAHLSAKQKVSFKNEVKEILKDTKLYQNSCWYADYMRLRLKVKKL